MNLASNQNTDSLESILQSTFGYATFRPSQKEIIQTIINGNNALVLMPTGRGKSLCYQIPALAMRGCGVVISPLIALMQDQVDALRVVDVNASFLNSTLSAAETRQTETDLLNNNLDLLYIAPERLKTDRTMELLQKAEISLFAIDEAHCVSQWGHDFRSDYLRLSVLNDLFPNTPRIALTATADERTRIEIAKCLTLENATHFVTGFDRPNIRYRITLKNSPRNQLLKFLKEEHPYDAGIVYCLSRKKTEETASWLSAEGFNALPYHAGLPTATRSNNQAAFLREEGIIVVATIAFGMGIDKPDVRFVAHLDIPKTVESYYQETGRAGRDGEAANAWMVYGLQDVIKLRQMMQTSEGSEQYKRAEQYRLNSMLGLCEITSCRRQSLLNYFGEELDEPCGNCDTCLEPVITWDGTEAAQKALSAAYRTGQRFGANHLIDVLEGNSTAKVNQFGHDKLPTFGIGTELNGNGWRSVFRQLVARGYLTVDVEGYGALLLDEQARPLLRGEQKIELRKDTHKASKSKQVRQKPLADNINPELFEALRARRTKLATQQGVPPYVIFHDKTLLEIAEYMPQDMAQFSQINGVGDSKLEKYGEEFLTVVQDAS
ncbi:MAG: DNA helicase RecQ [Arenicellaceae bacterium]|nr:DNA helicase RecQ [Arenicellaceae bacterium]